MIQNHVSVVKPKLAFYKAWVPIMFVTQATKAFTFFRIQFVSLYGVKIKNEF